MRNRMDFSTCCINEIRVDAFGAQGDGTGNQAPAINSAIEQSAEGSTIVFTPGATYQVNETIVLKENRTYIGYGATIKLQDAATGLTVSNTNLNVPTSYYPIVTPELGGSPKDNIVVKGLRIDGNGANQPNGVSYAGLTFENSTYMNVEDMYIFDVAQNLDILPATDRAFCFFLYKCTYARVVNCRGDNCGYDTLSIRGYEATDNQVIGGVYTRGQKTAAQIFDDAKRNILQGCTFDNSSPPNPAGDGSSAGALFIHGASSNKVEGCTLIGAVQSTLIIMGDNVAGSSGVTPRYANHNVIVGNVIRFTAATGGTIIEFSTAGSGYQYALFNILEDNFIEYTGGANRVLIGCPSGVLENIVRNNTMTSNGNQPLITMDACQGLDIRGNTMIMTATGTTLAVVRCDGTFDCSISDNRILADGNSAPFISTNASLNLQINNNYCEHRSTGAAAAVAAFLNTTATRIQFVGNVIKSGNSTAMFYFAGVSTNVRVTANTLVTGNNGTAPAFGIRFENAQNSPGNIVTDNDFGAATTALSTTNYDIRAGSITSNNRVTTANQITRNFGNATVAAGATTAVVTHGVFGSWGNGRAVRKSDIKITPTSDWLLSVKWWISAVTTTQFTLTVSAAPGGAGYDFAWEVAVEVYDGA